MTMPSRLVQILLGGVLLLGLSFYSGCRVERSRWQAEQQKTQRWIDSTSKAFALDTLRLALHIASLSKEAAELMNTRDSSLAAANQAAALARVSLQKLAKSRAAIAAAQTLGDTVVAQTAVIQEQDSVIQQQAREVGDLRSTLVIETKRAGKLQQAVDTLNGTLRGRDVRIASLDSALRVAASTPPSKLFGITLSPGVTLLAGIALGAVGTFVLQQRRP